MSDHEYGQRMLCRLSYIPGPGCKHDLRYGPRCKSANKCAYFKKTSKRSYFNHLKALISAHRDDDDPKKVQGILQNLSKDEILEISDDMRKLAAKVQKFRHHI